MLQRELAAAGEQSFLITPIALNGQRKTDKLNARAVGLRLAPIRIPSEPEQRQRVGTRRRKFLGRLIRMRGNRGPSQVAEYEHVPPPAAGGARATGSSSRRSNGGC